MMWSKTGKLSTISRKIFLVVIVIDVYILDIHATSVDEDKQTINDFEWLSQLG